MLVLGPQNQSQTWQKSDCIEKRLKYISRSLYLTNINSSSTIEYLTETILNFSP